ncbi:MAG: hypothetical protein AB8B74_05065 [Crocinitomicaceae bacterium]
MKIKKILIAVSILLSFKLSAQQVINKTTVDDPSALNNLGVRLYPWFADISFGKTVNETDVEDVSLGMGYGFDLFADPIPALNDKLSVQFKFRKNYFDGVDANVNQQYIRGIQIEFGGSWELLNSQTKSDENLVIDEKTDGRNRIITSLRDVETTWLHRLMLDGGIFRSKIPMISYTTGLQNYRLLASTIGIYSGMRFIRTMNYESEVFGFGNASDAIRVQAYAHIMYAPVINYSDVIVPILGFTPNGPDIKTHLDSNNAVPNLGGRIGLSVDMNPAALISYSFIAELGYKPPLNGFHIYLGASATVNLNVRPKKKK